MVGYMNNLTLHRWLVAFGWCLIACSAVFIHWYGMFEEHRTTPHAYVCLFASVWWTNRMSRHVFVLSKGVCDASRSSEPVFGETGARA